MDNQDYPDDPEQPNNTQDDDFKTNKKQNDIEKEDIEKGDTSVTIEGEGNDAIVIGGDVKDSAVKIDKSTNYIKDSSVFLGDITVKIQEAIQGGEKPQKLDEAILISFSQVDEKDLIRVENVFVEPENYRSSLDIIEKESNERIFFVQGSDNSGKFITAIKIGLDIFRQQNIKEKKVFSQISKNINIRSLIIFLETSTLQKESIYIIRDVFEQGLSISDFSDTVLSALNKFLRVNNSFLILTTAKSRDDLGRIKSHMISSQISESRLSECFINHLKYRRKKDAIRPISDNIVSLIDASVGELNRDFKNPNQIEYFFDQISRDKLQTMVGLIADNDSQELIELDGNGNTTRLKDALLKLAQRSRKYGLPDQESTQLWFDGLHENIKLFALLAIILQGFKFELIEEIYEKSVRKLIDDGVESIEHQSVFGRNKILVAIHAKIEDESFLVFDNQAYVSEIRRQIDNRHLLLWTLVDLFIDYIYGYKAREFWVLRRELGAAISRIGIYGYGKLEVKLDILAEHEEAGVVASAGYALSEICNLDSRHYPYVINVITRWVDSGNPDLMWAAGTSIWRVYDSLMRILKNEQPTSPLYRKTEETIQEIYACLTDLASKVDAFSEDIRFAAAIKLLQIASEAATRDPNLSLSVEEAKKMEGQLTVWTLNNIDSVRHAVRQMFWLNPNGIVKLVKEWINTDQTNNLDAVKLIKLGLSSANELFKQANEIQKQGFHELNIPLMDLVESLLMYGDYNNIEVMMKTFNNWMLAPELTEQFERLIIPIVNRLGVYELHRFRNGIINYWLAKDVHTAHRLGKFLVGRSYAIEGVPLGLSADEKSILLWDTSLAARKERVDKLARNYYIRINARQSVNLYPIGQAQQVIFSDTYPSIEDLQLVSDRPALIYPIINSEIYPVINSERTRRINFIVAIIYDQIQDIEDLEIDLVKEKYLFVRLMGVPREPVYDIPSDQWIEREDYLRLEQFLDVVIASSLARAEEKSLWNQISSFTDDNKNIDNIFNLLNNWVEQIDDPLSIRFKDTEMDLAKIISCSLVWLARQDLDACLQLLESWITTQPIETNNSRPLQRRIGISGGRLVVNVLAQSKNVEFAKIVQIFKFVELLVKQGNWENQWVALTAIKSWIKTEESFQTISQVKRVTASSDSEESSENLLSIIVEYTPKNNYSDLLTTMEKWLQDKNSNIYLKRAARQIKTKVLLGRNINFNNYSSFEKNVILSIEKGSELPENQKYCLIIFNSYDSDTDNANIAAETYFALSKDFDYYPIIFRVGHKMPVAIGKQEISHNNLLHSQTYELPQIIGPLLDNLYVRQFDFGIIFGSDNFHDKDDWHENWRKIFWFHYPVIDTSTIGWPPIVEEKSISKHKMRALQIIKFTIDRVKG